ncbi:MAG: saccharopine dehydrogenase C-terminal domain-containing protein [Bacteroidia bacterium]|nr:saccharopine dehydrogenase C-terminal domain-containing protein [Bacteroidia bacterium]
MPSILLLGAGRVGRAIALDLATSHKLIVADKSPSALQTLQAELPSLEIVPIDLTAPESLTQVAHGAELIVMALPGSIGYRVLAHLVRLGKKIVDISFFPEDPYSLAELARSTGAIVVVDAGVAPGLSNLILGYELSQMPIESFVCYVGGLPVERPWPFQYKAPFSPEDVIEEYTRPVRQRIGGRLVVKPPLSEVELVEIPPLGLLEAFNTDGLRTLLRTTQVPTLIEKTLRYPGHVEYMQVLKQTGFFSQEPIEVEGHLIIPRQVSLALLQKSWAMRPEEADLTVMKIHLRTEGGTTITYTLVDQADWQRRISSMARTTGYTCAAIATWLIEQASLPPGIYAPEEIAGLSGCFSYIINYLADRRVVLKRQADAA